ncbi:hypothetical protein PRK78_002147 [Emydomyces testavorans]|uniref:Uncharacterized protein n=1 Tax=Emydomyces testavorans TaxID=2070801 RepID=A0AAF0IJD2_9EURO|nr:hypothetical protein PRK78_002147 [Emydomyces testavorans]
MATKTMSPPTAKRSESKSSDKSGAASTFLQLSLTNSAKPSQSSLSTQFPREWPLAMTEAGGCNGRIVQSTL